MLCNTWQAKHYLLLCCWDSIYASSMLNGPNKKKLFELNLNSLWYIFKHTTSCRWYCLFPYIKCFAMKWFNLSIFHQYNIFHHLKLDIALAIPASNEWKIELNDRAANVFICFTSGWFTHVFAHLSQTACIGWQKMKLTYVRYPSTQSAMVMPSNSSGETFIAWYDIKLRVSHFTTWLWSINSAVLTAYDRISRSTPVIRLWGVQAYGLTSMVKYI